MSSAGTAGTSPVTVPAAVTSRNTGTPGLATYQKKKNRKKKKEERK
jgi:hypothetical protein